MSVVAKIPPLVSALAFGYGVGMAAPESTIASVHGAVEGYRAAAKVAGQGASQPQPARQAGPNLPSALGGESHELARLRDASPEAGGSCELEKPSYSKKPRYESGRGSEDIEDVDELDVASTAALSRLQLPDLRLTITKRTLKYVKFFTRSDRGRGMFETWLKRSGRYQDLVQRELRDRRLPEDLIWLAMIESGFDPRARSPAGAVGMWQFMPATGGVYGLQRTAFLDQRRNPRLATQAAAHHLRDLYMRFGDWNLALAAYNMGYEQLLNAIDKYGTADFNELARQEAIPRETAAYVPKIAAAALVANNLERFGFDRVELSRPLESAEIPVPGGTPLRVIAKACGVSLSQIKGLNPDLLGEKAPPGRGDHIVLVPPDTVSRALASLPSLMRSSEDEAVGDVLDPADLLGGRAFDKRKIGGGLSADSSLLSLLPKPKSRRSLRERIESGELDDALAAIGREATQKAARGDDDLGRPRGRRAGRQTVLYRVGPGDTLLGIAREYAMDLDDVASENGLAANGALKAGALLKLRVRPDVVDSVRLGAREKKKEKEEGNRDERGDRRDQRDQRDKRKTDGVRRAAAGQPKAGGTSGRVSR